jgi:hypothetical protein
VERQLGELVNLNRQGDVLHLCHLLVVDEVQAVVFPMSIRVRNRDV